MKALVTGGAGFIGSNLVRELLALGHEITVLDNLSTGYAENIDGLDIQLIEEDIRNYDAVSAAVRGCEAVFHLAALPSVARSMLDPITTTDVNVNGTVNLLAASADNNVRVFVFSSSSSVYGDRPEPEKVESMDPRPVSPYAASKLSGEYYCRVFSEAMGLSAVCLRYFNVFGPGQDAVSEYSAVIPRFISRLLRGELPQIYGDGEQSRDFTPVRVAVQANILAATRPGLGGEIFNVACGNSITVNRLAALTTENISGLIDKCKSVAAIDKAPGLEANRLQFEYLPARKGDIRHSRADMIRSRTVLGLDTPDNIEEAVQEVCEWFARRFPG